ncbi:HAMP domain-containing sensor histidine kinase [Demequina sp.]|uniref:sensor histidine kinase n=1 Tax=Demequina sp. TaxID=2050685 RepID=UPI0025E9F7A7|nr:HAMP domain-containing sensor histidine kinase [Demequina sp.]
MIVRRTLARLTVAYSVIQLVLFAVAALAIYVFVSITFDFDVVETDTPSGIDAADHALSRLRVALVVVYAALVVVVPVVSYLMARVALAPLRRSYESQQQFVDATSHEFRTPLGVIIGELSLALMRPRAAAEYREAIEASLGAAEGLAALTNQLLLLSRDDPESLVEERTSLEVEALLAEAAEAVRSGDPSVEVAVAPCPGLTVEGSRELLVHALRNVIDNARKYGASPAGITVEALGQGAHVDIAVTDRGPGLTAADVDRAFDRFWRAPAARGVSGHGLGLSLVRQIVDAHGGRVRIDSAPGTGTTVTLSLPR